MRRRRRRRRRTRRRRRRRRQSRMGETSHEEEVNVQIGRASRRERV